LNYLLISIIINQSINQSRYRVIYSTYFHHNIQPSPGHLIEEFYMQNKTSTMQINWAVLVVKC